MFLEFESPQLNVLCANLCTTHNAKRLRNFLVIYMVLQCLDLRIQIYLLSYDGTHTCVGCTSYVSSCRNLENESVNQAKGEVLDSSPWISFPFDPCSELNCCTYLVMLGQDDKYHLDGSVDTFPWKVLLEGLCHDQGEPPRRKWHLRPRRSLRIHHHIS